MIDDVWEDPNMFADVWEVEPDGNGGEMMTPKEYTEQFRIYARGLDAEGWSQTAIAKDLGVPR